MPINRVTVSAASNIALVKYWGKRESDTNEPATASLSIGLEDLRTRTIINRADSDSVEGLDADAADRLIEFLEQFREDFGLRQHFSITTTNNFPTGSGLASSASGFAAIAVGLDALLDLKLSERQQSQLARRGSGSAARSIHGGYVQIRLAEDSYAEPLLQAQEWPLDVVVAITSEAGKQIGSTEAMKRTAATSPYYPAWIKSHDEDMKAAREAIADRDFEKLTQVSEHNCLKMHSAIMSSQPPIHFWLPATMGVMLKVIALREQGLPAFFTVDAGSQVKVICDPTVTDRVETAISQVAGVIRTVRTKVGGKPTVTRE